jgi:hypothetical protein
MMEKMKYALSGLVVILGAVVLMANPAVTQTALNEGRGLRSCRDQ